MCAVVHWGSIEDEEQERVTTAMMKSMKKLTSDESVKMALASLPLSEPASTYFSAAVKSNKMHSTSP